MSLCTIRNVTQITDYRPHGSVEWQANTTIAQDRSYKHTDANIQQPLASSSSSEYL